MDGIEERVRPALRVWLRANSLFSLTSGAAALLASRQLPVFLGAGGTMFYAALGWR